MSEARIETTEKITININTIDLGHIDLLVNEGYYATRTEFIKTAVKKQLDRHEEDTKKLIEQKAKHGDYELSIGVGGFTKSELERIIQKKEAKIKMIFIGLFITPKDVTLELLEQAVESIKVYGVCRCSQEIKDRYGL
jgi:Arc/MetJ-type ribon-helix-helix transcriptional regulator